MPQPYQGPELFASESFQDLEAFLRESRERPAGGRDDFESFERELHARMTAIEAELVGKQLERYDVDADEIEIYGEKFRRKQRFAKEYQGLSGSFSVERTLYVPKDGRGRAIVPLELRTGIVEGAWTPLLARVMARTVASTTPKEAEEIFAEFGGAKPSTSSLDRLPKRLSEVWEAQREAWEEELRSTESVPDQAVAVAVALDGVLIPMKPQPNASEPDPSKRKSGPRDYQEASCGTVSFYDEDGERRGTVRYARPPEHKKKTLKAQLEAELESIFAVRPDLTLVCLSDGAQDHWEFLSELAKRLGVQQEVRQAADFFHVAERVKKALDAYHGEGSVESRAEFEKCRLWLKERADGAARVLRSLRHKRDRSSGAKRETITEQIKYIENRKKGGLLEYKTLLDENLPIGSGVVEAACKTLATQRLKCSGMSWSHDGAEAILTLRSLIQSDRWSRAWPLLGSHYRVPVKVTRAA